MEEHNSAHLRFSYEFKIKPASVRVCFPPAKISSIGAGKGQESDVIRVLIVSVR